MHLPYQLISSLTVFVSTCFFLRVFPSFLSFSVSWFLSLSYTHTFLSAVRGEQATCAKSRNAALHYETQTDTYMDTCVHTHTHSSLIERDYLLKIIYVSLFDWLFASVCKGSFSPAERERKRESVFVPYFRRLDFRHSCEETDTPLTLISLHHTHTHPHPH